MLTPHVDMEIMARAAALHMWLSSLGRRSLQPSVHQLASLECFPDHIPFHSSLCSLSTEMGPLCMRLAVLVQYSIQLVHLHAPDGNSSSVAEV